MPYITPDVDTKSEKLKKVVINNEPATSQSIHLTYAVKQKIVSMEIQLIRSRDWLDKVTWRITDPKLDPVSEWQKHMSVAHSSTP